MPNKDTMRTEYIFTIDDMRRAYELGKNDGWLCHFDELARECKQKNILKLFSGKKMRAAGGRK